MSQIKEKQILFESYIQPATLILAAVGSVVALLIGMFFGSYSLGFAMSLVVIAVCLSVRNWMFLNQLAYSELESSDPVREIMPWLIAVWVASLGSCYIVILYYTDVPSSIRSTILASVGFLVGIINLWLPRYIRVHQERIRRAENALSWKNNYDRLRKDYYELIEEPFLDWKDEKNVEKLTWDRKLEIKSLEAQAIFSFKEFKKVDTKPLDLRSLIILFLSTIGALVLDLLGNAIWQLFSENNIF